jgi:Non-histone chromosomal protein MC1
LGGYILAETRNFALRDKKGNEIGVFAGKQPRQAALKAANRGHTDIFLRERGTKKVHHFKGERVQVKKPKGAPTWMPDKIWKPKVKKIGVETLEEI